MPDHAALREVWPEHGSLEAKLALVNSMQTAGPPVDISVAYIRERLAPRMSHLECYALVAKTRDLRRRLNMPAVPQSVTSAIYLLQLLSSADRVIGQYKLPVLRSLLDDLVADESSGITRELADNVLALSSSTVSWWSRHGFSQPVNTYDVIEAQLS
jgi:hypothetical protein